MQSDLQGDKITVVGCILVILSSRVKSGREAEGRSLRTGIITGVVGKLVKEIHMQGSAKR